MSLCYDFEKWTMLTLVLVAATLGIGLMMVQAYDGEPKWGEMLIKKCVFSNSTYFYMLVSNSTECGGIVKWYDTHNWQFVTELDGKIVLIFENKMTAKERAFEEGIVENK